MALDPQILSLLEEVLDSGRTPEEVCRGREDLAPEVRRLWERSGNVMNDVDALFPLFPEGEPSRPSVSPHGTKTLPKIAGYEILDVIGHGGVGVVYRAVHLRLGRTVALKMLLSGAYASPHELARFKREAEAIARLQNEHIVQIHDVGDVGGSPYFTMEYAEGGTLAQKLGDSPQPSRQVAALGSVLARAVQTMHAASIVHRDLKPGNILLATNGVAKISDFGLAHLLDGDETLTSARVGTPSYMAPEQSGAGAGAVGPAADIYSLGAILYKMLTGRPPFQGETPAETERQLVNQEPVPPSRLNSSVPRDLETICLKCIQKSPQQRYGSAVQLAEDLERWMRGEPITARPIAPIERAVKWVRRRPVHAAALAGVLMLAAATAIGAGWISVARAQTARGVDADLGEAVEMERKSDWVRAAAALDRAEVRLAGRSLGGLASRLRLERENLAVAAHLDAIPVRRIASGQDHRKAYLASAVAYRAELQRAGVGHVGQNIDEVAGSLATSPLCELWKAALDDWISVAMEVQERDWLVKLMGKLDHDPTGWRDRVRDPSLWQDRTALTELVNTAALEKQPVGLQMALAARLQNSGGNALDYARKIQETHPDNFWANEKLAMWLTVLGPSEEAVGYARAAVAIRKDEATAHVALGFAKGQLGQIDEEIECDERALQLDPNLVSAQNNIAMAFARKERWDEATQHFEAVRKIDPTFPNADIQVGTIMFLAGKYDQARVRYERAVLAEPGSRSGHLDLALLLQDMGKPQQAATEYEKVLEIDPKQAEAMARLASIRREQGDFRTAETLARRSLEIEPASIISQHALRQILIATGKTEEAIRLWQAWLEARPTDHEGWYGYAELCMYMGRAQEYDRARTQLLAQFGSTLSPVIAERVARACLIAPATKDVLAQSDGLCDVAISHSKEVSYDYNKFFLFAKGLAEYRAGNFEASIARMNGDASYVLGPAPQMVIAMALYRTGRKAEAREVLKAALASYDWNPDKVVDQDACIIHVLRREALATVKDD